MPESKRDELLSAVDDDECESTAVVAALGTPRRSQRPSVRDRHLLVGTEGSRLGQVVAVVGEEFTVGRLPANALWLDDSGVSRQHAHLVWGGTGYELRDLGSVNGSYVQGERVSRRQLADGHVVQFGPHAVFRYSVTDPEQEAMLHHLYEASVKDPLTGACNREHLDARLGAEVAYAARHAAELSLLLFDVDHFKRINDEFGHLAGDRLLVALAEAVAPQLRTEDLLGRYGGEEFAVVLRTTPLPIAQAVAERLRATIETVRVEHGGRALGVTVSIGCASLACIAEASPKALVNAADRRLYAAKRAGRNCVVAEA